MNNTWKNEKKDLLIPKTEFCKDRDNKYSLISTKEHSVISYKEILISYNQQKICHQNNVITPGEYDSRECMSIYIKHTTSHCHTAAWLILQNDLRKPNSWFRSILDRQHNIRCNIRNNMHVWLCDWGKSAPFFHGQRCRSVKLYYRGCYIKYVVLAGCFRNATTISSYLTNSCWSWSFLRFVLLQQCCCCW